MEKSIKFIGVCLVLCVILICGTLIFLNFYGGKYADRYSIVDNNMVLDKKTGIVYHYEGTKYGFEPYPLQIK